MPVSRLQQQKRGLHPTEEGELSTVNHEQNYQDFHQQKNKIHMTHQVVKSFISDSLYDSSDWAGQQWTADHLYCSHFPYLARDPAPESSGGERSALVKNCANASLIPATSQH